MLKIMHCFPQGKRKVVTLSYDDGQIYDRRLVEILDQYGIKGTFHLNSGSLGKDPVLLERDEIKELYRNHEVSAHSVTHPHFESIPLSQVAFQMLEDRRDLESLVGYPVRGMSYPYGSYNRQVAEALPHYGIEYSRVGQHHGRFHLPDDWLRWQPTCHHKHDLSQKTQEFIDFNPPCQLSLLYVWGHSFEFARENNWEIIEAFCQQVSDAASQIWFATNIEIFDYMAALQNLRLSVDGSIAHNRSAIPVWLDVTGEVREIGPNEIVCFN